MEKNKLTNILIIFLKTVFSFSLGVGRFLKSNLPNIITSFRLLLTPLAMVLLMSISAASLAWCLLVVAIIEITDLLDGWLARRLNRVSNFGKLFDPFCDMTFHLLMFLCLTVLGVLSIWIMTIFLLREMTVWFLRFHCAARGIILGARPWGKRKANSQTAMLIAIIAALGAHLWGVPLAVDAGLMALSVLLTLVAVVVTIISLGDYLYHIIKEIRHIAR
ncbi:MAG: CDP-diacylglycerol--glycerol-3-phosphate 3-phosphatidyltransferase [Candidatus Buchananbacteria bacterium]